VADSVNNTIRKITSAGVVTTLAGQAGSRGSADGSGSAARFNNPTGVALDSGGTVYVADEFNNTIRKITSAGVVTTLAGLPGGEGSADGTGAAARFILPTAVAVDSAGTAYVADSVNNTIRKITSAGVVTTLAGQAGSRGSADGSGSAARFNNPTGVAVDSAGNLYGADSGNNTIRKITSAGVVTTLAGVAGSSGNADGIGGAAQFTFPNSVAVDRAGNVYVADQGNHTIRKITSAGAVTTLAGLAGTSGTDDGTGSAALFNFPGGVTVDSAGNLYVADSQNSTIRKINSAGLVTTLAGLPGTTGRADGTGSDARFQTPSGIAVDNAGNLYVADSENNTIRKGFSAASQPLNISTRMQVLTGDNVLIAGFIITGPANSTKQVMIRGLGPSLSGVGTALSDPLLELRGPNSLLVINDNWQQAANASEIPAAFQPKDSREAVIVATLTVGPDGFSSYTAVVRGAKGETGVGLVEAYDLSPASNQLANISTRGFVGQGDNVMIAGFILGGQLGSKIMIRGLGPSVPVNGKLADPTLAIYDKNGTKITSNDDWKKVDGTGASQEAAIVATKIPPSSDLESAVLADLAPGAYTAILSGKDAGTGIGLIEVYNLK
jgi:sugar lactone lactonase YvrE